MKGQGAIMAFTESTVVDYTARTVYSIMEWSNPNYWVIWAGVTFLASMLSLAPWTLPKEHDFTDLMAHAIRRCLFWTGVSLVVGALFFFWCYDMSYRDRVANHWGIFQTWLWESFKANGWMPIGAALAGFGVRLLYFRYVHVWLSALFRRWRNTQSDEVESDIRTERERFNAKDFVPAKFYDPKGESIFVGLDTDGKPLTIPIDTWRETNMQIIGPTRYGKGVAAGCIMDQVVRMGDALFYIDPKKDRWAPHLLLQACMDTGRPFYYVALHDNSIGFWSPFEGGNRRDAYTRLTAIFEMQEGGDAGTDFYKAQEKKLFKRIIRMDQSFAISDIYHTIKSWNEAPRRDPKEKALKIEAQLENWSQIGALNPPRGVQGFSIEKALLEGACVYVQGDLMDETVKKATKAFIMELIQESMRLAPSRKHHVTIVIDELRFLVSKIVADALATAVGSRVNIVTMYQSILDLRSPDDVNLDGESILQSVNVNSQLKLIYGGADFETAKWVAELSGTRNKSVTAMEKTNIRTAGAEEYERGRTLKTLAEALIPENVVLTLPPRVCVLFRPRELAAVSHSSFVPVRNEESLPRWLKARKDEEDRVLLEQQAKSIPAVQADDEDRSILTSEPARAVNAMHSPAPAPVSASADPLPRFQIAELVAKGLDSLPEDQFNYCFGTAKRKEELKALIGQDAYKAAEKKWQEGKKAKARAKAEASLPQIPKHEQHFFDASNPELQE
jgi:hypothetical protein